MIYTIVLRGEDGREVSLTELAVSQITESTVFLCPETSNQLTAVHIEAIRHAFDKVGVRAIVCNTPMRLYQLKPFEPAPPGVSTEGAAWAADEGGVKWS